MRVEVRETGDPSEVAGALELREEVFCGEQGVSREAELDGRDSEAVHVVAHDDGALVGTCRLLIGSGAPVRLGRLAVRAGARRRGVASAILQTAESAATARGGREIELHAQTAAIEIYEEAGYEASGDPFLEEGIEHVTMRKRLA